MPSLYTAELSFVSQFVLIPIASMVSLFILFLLPGMIWRRSLFRVSVAKEDLFTSWFLVTLLLFTGATTVFKTSTHVALTQSSFLAIYAIVLVSGIVVLLMRGDRRGALSDAAIIRSKEVWIGFILCCVVMALMYDKVFIEAFIVDGIESFEFSKSLQSRVLPNWDLENGYFGFYPHFMLFSYPNAFSIMSYGEYEAAIRLPFFLYLFLTYVITVTLIYPDKERPWPGLLVIALAFLLLATLHGYYYAWGIHTDLAQPATTDLLFLLLVLLSSFYLINKRYVLFFLLGSLAVIALPIGRLFLVLMILSFVLAFRPNKQSVMTLALSAGTLLIAIELLYKLYVAFNPQGDVKWSITFMIAQYVDFPTWNNLFWDVKVLLIAGGIAPLAACFLFPKDATSKFFLYLAFFYFAFVLVNPYEKIHYFMPLSLLPTIIALRNISHQDTLPRMAWYVAFGVSFLSLLVYYYPRDYRAQTLARTVGARTCIEFPSYAEAARQTVRVHAALPLRNFGINPHSWIHYSDLTHCPKDLYDFYFTPRALSESGYVLNHRSSDSYFYIREGAQLEW